MDLNPFEALTVDLRCASQGAQDDDRERAEELKLLIRHGCAWRGQ
jgi:hypothetical protein